MGRYLAAAVFVFNLIASFVTIASFPRISSDILGLIIEQDAGGYKLESGTYSINPYLFSALVSLIITSIAAVMYGLYTFQFRTKLTKSKLASAKEARERHVENENLRKALRTIGVQSGLISFPGICLHLLREAKYRYHISNNYDGEISLALTIEAHQELMFWEFHIYADSNADPVGTYKDIEPSARILKSNVPREVFFLPIEEQSRRVHMLAAFAPMLRKGDIVELQISARWPGLFKTLKKNGVDVIEWPAFTNDSPDSASTSLEVSTDRRVPKIMCKNFGHRVPGERLDYDDKHNSWTYSAERNFSDKDVNLFSIQIEFANRRA